ncbi:Alpha/Beta hydrolase protein [Podospora conica]|nr:Alpha/Beta hydrolase protein [Schizothecium conicum]
MCLPAACLKTKRRDATRTKRRRLSPRQVSLVVAVLVVASYLYLTSYASPLRLKYPFHPPPPPSPPPPQHGDPPTQPSHPGHFHHPPPPPPHHPPGAMPAPAPPQPPKASKPAVVLTQGRYTGTTILASAAFPRAIDAFRGIPFAQSTGGENRFRPPQPLPPSDAEFPALQFGLSCPREGWIKPGTGEDCLNLNVYRTAGLVDAHGRMKKAGDKLPVIVYVHGGAFNTGCGVERNMASFVSWAEDAMIGINFNYRVGALGFLPSEVTAREGLLNLGLRDQQMLFDWVHDNIEAFGGDPDNVTIMGLSAGAHSIGHHLMYYAGSSRPAPFAKAIMESGATTARATFLPTHPRHLKQFREFLAFVNLGAVPDEDVFPRLRALPLIDIIQASRKVWDLYSASVTWPFQPVIDAPHRLANSSHPPLADTPPVLIPDLPINSWRHGHHLRIPVLTGYNTNEGTLFIPGGANTNTDFRAFFSTLIPGLLPADLDALDALYPDPVTDPHPDQNPYTKVPPGKGRQWARLDAAYAHYAYICPVLQTAHFLSTDNTTEAAKAPVYVYRYAAQGAWHAANHGDEAPVVAHDMALLAGEGLVGLTRVADAMHGAWARFVVSKSGDPNQTNNSTGKAVDWPAYVSPFPRDQGNEAWAGAVRRGEAPDAAKGRKMVFGRGNDERAGVAEVMWGWRPAPGARSAGTPAEVEGLSDVEMAAYFGHSGCT